MKKRIGKMFTKEAQNAFCQWIKDTVVIINQLEEKASLTAAQKDQLFEARRTILKCSSDAHKEGMQLPREYGEYVATRLAKYFDGDKNNRPTVAQLFGLTTVKPKSYDTFDLRIIVKQYCEGYLLAIKEASLTEKSIKPKMSRTDLSWLKYDQYFKFAKDCGYIDATIARFAPLTQNRVEVFIKEVLYIEKSEANERFKKTDMRKYLLSLGIELKDKPGHVK
ncbi:hypothetical protein [Thalassomonas sp. M1454]|uniref:hypothetical protein n=1 Tax=Thalassomonas sp. M1454 TaxID=2594477 RepID=UPI00118050F6|nr:hypothetical protein [Thalassomonas sp. M1454]TRX52754.1 hypothetical protein FNN08_15445 [Thalassomonas sp. M1454]